MITTVTCCTATSAAAANVYTRDLSHVTGRARVGPFFCLWTITITMSEEPLYILSDSEDELHLRVNSEHISLKKPTTDEIVPDSEGESESLPLISYTPPRQRHQLEQPNAHLSSPLSSIPSHSKRKDDYSQEIPKAKKMKQAKVSPIMFPIF